MHIDVVGTEADVCADIARRQALGIKNIIVLCETLICL